VSKESFTRQSCCTVFTTLRCHCHCAYVVVVNKFTVRPFALISTRSGGPDSAIYHAHVAHPVGGPPTRFVNVIILMSSYACHCLHSALIFDFPRGYNTLICVCGHGSDPDPVGGAYSAPSDLLSGFRERKQIDAYLKNADTFKILHGAD